MIDGQNCEELPYCRILNGLLPNDIRVLAWTPVADDFSARFSCKMRTYKYWFPRGDMNIEVSRLQDFGVNSIFFLSKYSRRRGRKVLSAAASTLETVLPRLYHLSDSKKIFKDYLLLNYSQNSLIQSLGDPVKNSN